MPVAIIVSRENPIPVLIVEETIELLLERMQLLFPEADLADEKSARAFLQGLIEPSGWFDSASEAAIFLNRLQTSVEMKPADIIQARKYLGLSRAGFAQQLGFGGNDNTRHKHIFEIENGKRSLNSDATRALRSLLAQKEMAIASGEQTMPIEGRLVPFPSGRVNRVA